MVEKNIELDEEDESSLVAEAKKDAKIQKKTPEVDSEEDFDDDDELGDDDIDEIEEE